MSRHSTTITGLVIGKTKLGESDLIIRVLLNSGAKFEAVAKGARKPQSSLSAKVELFNEISALVSIGKGLGIIQECKLLCSHSKNLLEPLSLCAASCMTEFASKAAQPDLEVNRFYDLITTAIAFLEKADINYSVCACASYLLKATSILGFRPELRACAACEGVIWEHENKVLYSVKDGGVVCGECNNASDARYIEKSTIELADWLISNPFSSISAEPSITSMDTEIFSFAKEWTEFQTGLRLKSANALLSYRTSCV